jgi:tRNA dimethylallyltransferase
MADQRQPLIYAISGPTASGKTYLAVALALEIGAEIVNFDSVQVYRGIEIATAKPTEEEKRGVTHHLIDYVDPKINYSAGDWSRDAIRVIRDIESRNKPVVLVGGTGFYLRALRQPFFESPATDTILRERFRGIQRRKGAAHLHRLLTRVDPAAAAKLDANDHSRTIRALEVFFQTGRRISDVQPERVEPPDFADRIRLFVLNPPREVLYEKINRRTEQHFALGLVDEVKSLLSQRVREDTNALGAHAYRRVCEYLRGDRDLESAIEKSKQDVRNYAKRQLTWFRAEKDAVWLDGFGADEQVYKELKGLIDRL